MCLHLSTNSSEGVRQVAAFCRLTSRCLLLNYIKSNYLTTYVLPPFVCLNEYISVGTDLGRNDLMMGEIWIGMPIQEFLLEDFVIL